MLRNTYIFRILVLVSLLGAFSPIHAETDEVSIDVLPMEDAPVQIPGAHSELTISLFDSSDAQGRKAAVAKVLDQAKQDGTPIDVICEGVSCESLLELDRNRPPAGSIEIIKKPRRFLPKIPYKVTHTLVRSIGSGVPYATTLILSEGANWRQAVVAGTVAAAWSIGMQGFNDSYLTWLNKRGFFKIDRNANSTVLGSLGKKAVSSGVYGLLMHGTLTGVGLIANPYTIAEGIKIASSVGKSLFAQTSWQRLNKVWTDRAIKRNPEQTARYKRNSSRGSLVQSMLNSIGNALNMTGSPVGDIVSGAMGITGMATQLRDWRVNRAPASDGANSRKRCNSGFAGLHLTKLPD